MIVLANIEESRINSLWYRSNIALFVWSNLNTLGMKSPTRSFVHEDFSSTCNYCCCHLLYQCHRSIWYGIFDFVYKPIWFRGCASLWRKAVAYCSCSQNVDRSITAGWFVLSVVSHNSTKLLQFWQLVTNCELLLHQNENSVWNCFYSRDYLRWTVPSVMLPTPAFELIHCQTTTASSTRDIT